MKYHLLVVLLTLALPITANANDILNIAIGSGTETYTGGGGAVTSFLDFASWSSCLGGVCNTVQGLVIDSGTNFTIVNGNNVNGPVIFQGTFTSEDVVKNHINGQVEFQMTGVLKGFFTANPHEPPIYGFFTLETVPLTFSSCNGRGICSASVAGGFLELTQTPEPGTLAMLGTGIVGLAGVLCKKMSRKVLAS